VSKQTGYVVFTATAEMAKQMPKVFKAGATYVAQRATAVAVEPTPLRSTKKRSTKKKTKKRVAKTLKKKKKVAKKKVAKKKVAKKKVAKKVAKKTATAKSTKRKPIRPDVIIGFVRKNEGCNMTDIEGHTRLPQTAIRRVLNTAREAGSIRTEGQRRGLRYFVDSGQPQAAAALITTGASDN